MKRMWQSLSRILLSGALLCAAIANADEQPGVVKLGAILSLSGPAAHMGDAEIKTLQLYVERVNAKGGVLTRKLLLRYYDDRGDARAAADLARRFTTRDHDDPDHADFVIGGTTTETSLAIAPVLDKAGVPFLALGGGSRIVDPPRRWVFKSSPNERAAVRLLLTDMKKRSYQSIGLLAEDSEFGRECAKELHDQTGRNSLGRRTYGIGLEATQVYAPSGEDIAQKVARIKEVADLQAIAVFGLGDAPAAVTRELRAAGITLPIYHSHGVATNAFIQSAGKYAEGVRMPGPRLTAVDLLSDSDPQRNVIDAYVAAYRERYGQPPSAYGGYAYDALMLAIGAIERVDTLNAEELRRSLDLTRHHIGITGIYEDTPNNVYSLNPAALLMLEIREGAWRLAD